MRAYKYSFKTGLRCRCLVWAKCGAEVEVSSPHSRCRPPQTSPTYHICNNVCQAYLQPKRLTTEINNPCGTAQDLWFHLMPGIYGFNNGLASRAKLDPAATGKSAS